MKKNRNNVRSFPRIDNRLLFKIITPKYNLIAETINISCTGAFCRVNRAIPIMKSLKIILKLPFGMSDDDFEYVECYGIPVRVEAILSKGNICGLYKTAIVFNEIENKAKKQISEHIKWYQKNI
jgi:hypothetical protein